MKRTTRTLALIFAVFVLTALMAQVASADPLIQVLTNNGFEADDGILPVMTPWTISNKSGDKIVCFAKAPAGHTGDCAFMFKGGANEAAVLKQTVTDVSGLNTILDSSTGYMSVHYDYLSASSASKIKATLTVSYTVSGNPHTLKSKSTTKAHGAVGVFTTQWPTALAQIPENATISAITVNFKNQSASAKLYIDEVEAVFGTSPA